MQSLTLSPSITLFQGDALDVLRSLPGASVDMVLTDPPYSSGGSTLSARQADPAQKYQLTRTQRAYPTILGDAKDQHSWILWSTLWLSQCWRAAREGAVCLIFTDWRQLPSLTDALQAADWKWLGILPWDKRSARPHLGRFKQQCEFLIFGVKGRFHPNTRQCLPGLYSYPVIPARKNHLTAKPVQLIRELLAIAPEGGSVLDPFMGGGSVGAACIAAGHPYTGVELSPEYFDISSRWLADLAGLPLEGQPCA